MIYILLRPKAFSVIESHCELHVLCKHIIFHGFVYTTMLQFIDVRILGQVKVT